MNILNNYFLGEIGTGTREQGTTENSSERRSVSLIGSDVK